MLSASGPPPTPAAGSSDPESKPSMVTQTELNPNPARKPSNAEWIGNIPAHWVLRRLKSCAFDVADLTKHRRHDDAYVALEHVESWTGRITEPDDEVIFDSQVKRFNAGDILFGKLRPYLAKVTQPQRPGVCVGEFLVLRPCEGVMAPGYLERLMRSKPMIDLVDASTFGAKMPRASWHFVGNVTVPVPPPDEQAAIVRYLDHADELINRYISAKERLIALLEEERQAVIHQAVTRGLGESSGPNPHKKTGIPWCPEIPAHWDVKRAKQLFCKMARPPRDDDKVVTCFRDGQVTLRENRRTEGFTESLQEIGYQGIHQGDLVVHSMDAFAGAIGVSDSDGKATPVYTVCTMRLGANAHYYAAILREMARSQWILALATGIRERSTDFRYATLAQQLLPEPPPAEQFSIISYVRRNTRNIDKAIKAANSQIAFMSEYRHRLISDVVTGQIDVREATVGVR